MPAYMIADIHINDATGYEEYRRAVGPSIAQYGGKFLVRGGRFEVLEGDWTPSRLVVIEFESLERARAWSDSPEYAPAKAMRHRTATTSAVIVEGG